MGSEMGTEAPSGGGSMDGMIKGIWRCELYTSARENRKQSKVGWER